MNVTLPLMEMYNIGKEKYTIECECIFIECTLILPQKRPLLVKQFPVNLSFFGNLRFYLKSVQ